MRTIVFDLEWNQSSSGKEPEIALMPFEIIEIGAIQLNDDFRMVGEFSELIKPVVYPKLFHITSRLIHLQMKELERGDSFENVSRRFREWCGEDYIFCTWGISDIVELQRNLKFFNQPLIAYGPVFYYDVQKLFALAYEGEETLKTRRNLEYAVDFLGIEKDIPFHRAFSDAYYTAKIYERIVKEHPEVMEFKSVDTTIPPANGAEEINITFSSYSKYVSRLFNDKLVAMADKKVLEARCYKCNRPLKKTLHWFSGNGKMYQCLAKCDKHGELKCKLRIQHSFDDKVYVVKTSKLVDSHEADEVRSKYAKAKNKAECTKKS